MPNVTNNYYTEQFQGQAGQTARAEEVTSEFDAVQGGFDKVATDTARSIKAPSGETLNDIPAALTRANKWLRFDANGQPIPVNAPFNWMGIWQPDVLYYVGDVVQKDVHQSLYYCETEHTSGASFDDANWSTFIDLSGVAFFNYRIINTAGTHNLLAGDSVMVDASGGAITLALPASPVLGDSPINVTHVGGSLSGSQTIQIVTAAGTYFQGNVETTLTVDTTNASFSLSYGGPSYGWRLRVMG